MSGIMDFLFEGKPPASVTTYGSTTDNMPRWLSDYTQGLISRANATAAEPYQPYGGPRLAAPGADVGAGYEMVRGAVGPTNQGFQSLMGQPGAIASAQPYLAGASRTFPGAASEYMSPYSENVINRSTTLANRALTEKFMPALQATFGARGMDSRSSAYRRAADRGVRDITEGLQEQAAAQLDRGYSQAGQMFGQDASRMAQLAGTVGNMQGMDLERQGNLLEAAQRAGITGGAALETVGRGEQSEQQRSLDLAHQDFLEQRDYPRSTVDWMNSVVRGVPYDRNVSTTETGPADIYGPSPIASLGSLATGIAGLGKMIKRRGGRVERRSKGGTIRRVANLRKVPRAQLERSIATLQGVQKEHAPGHERWGRAGEELEPLFAEMARRQKAGELSRGGRARRGTI